LYLDDFVLTHIESVLNMYEIEIQLFMNAPGVDVMITIFCDVCQFSAKKWLFLTTNVVIIFFVKTT
jgi:hypothetical protein